MLPGWNMIATYSHLPFAKITKDNSVLTDDDGNIIGITSDNQSNRLFGAAEHTSSYWNTYEFRTGALRGLKIGGGIQGIGKRQGDAENSFHLPAFVIGNLMASYRTKLMKKITSPHSSTSTTPPANCIMPRRQAPGTFCPERHARSWDLCALIIDHFRTKKRDATICHILKHLYLVHNEPCFQSSHEVIDPFDCIPPPSSSIVEKKYPPILMSMN